ncbi:MAG: HAD family hydrolase [Infirmifilum sp.]
MQDLKSLLDGVKLFSFDIDGTIIDSYSYMRDVIEILLLYIGVPPNMLQPVSNDALEAWYARERNGTMDYSKMPELLEEAAAKRGLKLNPKRDELYDLLTEARVKASPTLPCAIRLLRELKNIGKIVVTVSGGDGVPGLKRRRLELGNLSKFFDEIIVVPEDSPSRVEALVSLAFKYGLSYSEVAHIDDRVEFANMVSEAGFRALVVKTGMYNPEVRIREDVFVIDNLCAIYEILSPSQEKPSNSSRRP